MHDLKRWDKVLEEMSNSEIREALLESVAENQIIFVPLTAVEVLARFRSIFKCQRSGACCVREMSKIDCGIGIREYEVERLASLKGMPREEFVSRYAKDAKGERPDDYALALNYPCPFYEGGCTIYDNRPLSCKFFPLGAERVEGQLTFGIQVACPGGLLAAQKILIGIKKGG